MNARVLLLCLGLLVVGIPAAAPAVSACGDGVQFEAGPVEGSAGCPTYVCFREGPIRRCG